jgi:hypothetical protein
LQKKPPKNYLPARLRPFLDSQKLRITAYKLQKMKNIKQDSSICKMFYLHIFCDKEKKQQKLKRENIV